MSFLVANNLIVSRPHERQPAGTPHARANSWLFEPYITSKSLLNACSQRPVFMVLSSIFSQIRTYWCKSGPFPDQFHQKSPDPDQSPKKNQTKWEHC